MKWDPFISIHGRWCFLVDSETRPGLRHLVDLEPELDIEGNPEHGGEPWKCSCEAHQFKVTRPCKHVKAILRFLGPIFKYITAFPGATPLKVETKRTYQLDASKKYDATKTNPRPPERRLHESVHREPPRPADR